ncbi:MULTISPECIES: hypothetical protein [unclassified Streptomyces]|nr:hypothetical protein OIE76_26410 [Streptomyces sp. NBC_01727]
MRRGEPDRPVHLAGLDAIGRTRYMSIGEAPDDDINVYVTVARKG